MPSPASSPSLSPPRPPSSPSSASSLDTLDIFSAKSASTASFTSSSSLSSSLGTTFAAEQSTVLRSKTFSSSWSKDVRWLVPPTGSRLSRSSSLASSGSVTLHGFGLIELDSRPVRRPRRATTRRQRARTLQQNRMSAVWEEDEPDDVQSSVNHSNIQPRSRSSSHSPRRSRTAPSVRSSHTTASSPSSISASSRTVTLPTPLPVSSGITDTTTGYSSLTLPRAAYTPSKHPDRISSTVDLTRSGLAQTTMSAIAITRRSHHAISAPARLIRRLGASSSTSVSPKRLQDDISSFLSFTAHTPSPTKVPSTQVLVKIWAVGLDGLDTIMIRDKISKREGFGYVPGRSFVGRVIECGWNVTTVSRGDWVIGLTEVRKGGALAEFVVISHRRIYPCSNPALPTSLSIPQLALLPLSAIPAHRAARTLSHLPKSSKVLVLQADVGTGLLAAQELVHMGFIVTAQVPGGLRGWGSEGERRARIVVEGLSFTSTPSRRNTKIKGDVRCGDPLEVIRSLAVAKEEFDAVIDTIGGKDIWDACRAILKTNGQFTTLVGDMLYFHTHSNSRSPLLLTTPAPNSETPCTLPTAQTHFLSNLRSLRFSLLKKDKKNIGYVWISPYADVGPTGENIRDTLASVTMLSDNGIFKPCVNSRTLPQNGEERESGAGGYRVNARRSQSPLGSVTSNSTGSSLALNFDSASKVKYHQDHSEGLIFPFERAPEALNGSGRSGTTGSTIGTLMQGGTVVIQIVE